MNQMNYGRPGGARAGAASLPPGSPGGLMMPGGTQDNPLAMGLPGGPPMVTLPMTPVRMGMAASLDMMRHTSAPVTVFAEVDATHLKALHDWIKPRFEQETGIPLTYTPFFARAATVALQAFPLLNSMLTPHGHIVPRTVHLGVVAQAPGGVLIPTIFSAEGKNIPQLAREIHVQGQKARAGQLGPHEQAGATFVITNTGKFGQTLFGTPTIKPPNVGVLAFEAIKKRPVALDNDQVVARPMMHLALTADHRAVDGADMMGFIGKVKHVLENLAF